MSRRSARTSRSNSRRAAKPQLVSCSTAHCRTSSLRAPTGTCDTPSTRAVTSFFTLTLSLSLFSFSRLEISRVVDTALTILEARRWHLTATTTSGNLGRTPPPVGKVFVVPVTRGNVNRAVLLGVVLSLLAPTYHTGDHDVQSQKSAKGAAPTIGINDAIADMNGVMHRLVGDMKNGDSPPHRHSEIDADAVRLLQVHLRAITWRTHSSWDLLSKKRSGEKVDDACWCALSPEYVAKHEWHWPPVSHVVAPPKRKAEQQLARQQARQRASLAEEPIDLTGDDACMVLSEIAMPARVVRVKLEHEAAEIPRQIHQAVEVPLAIVVQAVVTLVSPVLSPFHMSNSSSSSSSSELPDWPMLDDNSGFSGYQSPMAQLTDLDAADSYFSSAYEQVVHHTTPLSPVPEYDSSSLPPVRTDAHVWPAVPQVPMEEIAPTRPSTPVVEPPVVVAPPAAPPAAPVDPTSIPHPLAAFMSVVTCARTVTQAQMDSFWSLDTFAREAAMHGVIIAVKDLAIARG